MGGWGWRDHLLKAKELHACKHFTSTADSETSIESQRAEQVAVEVKGVDQQHAARIQTHLTAWAGTLARPKTSVE